MTKYCNKVINVDALKWTGTGRNQREMYSFLTNTLNESPTTEGKTFKIIFCNGGCSLGDLYIKTINGEVKANIGDYIIKDSNGNYYPCPPEKFEAEYEEVI